MGFAWVSITQCPERIPINLLSLLLWDFSTISCQKQAPENMSRLWILGTLHKVYGVEMTVVSTS